MLPVGRFEVWEARSGAATIQPCSCRGESDCNEMDWVCEEPYEKVKALIAAAQEQEPENKKLFIPVTHISGAPVLIEVSRVGVVDGYGENGTARIFDSQGDGLKDRWLVRESVEEVHRLIKEAQEG